MPEFQRQRGVEHLFLKKFRRIVAIRILQSKTDIFGEPKVDTCFEVVEQMRGFRQVAEIVVGIKIEIIKAAGKESAGPQKHGDFGSFKFWEYNYWRTDVPTDRTYQPL